MKPFRIHWRGYTWSSSIPSFRYRCLIPALALKEAGIATSFITKPQMDACLETGFDALVLVKAVSSEELLVARAAKAHGRPVILDICDNLFFWGPLYDQKAFTEKYFHHVHREALLRAIVAEVDAVVVPTVSLQRRMLQEFPDKRIVVIPDALETSELRAALDPTATTFRLARDYYFGSLYLFLKVGMWESPAFFYSEVLHPFFYQVFRIGRGAMRRLVFRPFHFLKHSFQAFLTAVWPGIDRVGHAKSQTISESFPQIATWKAPAVDPAGRRRLIWFGNSGTEGVFGISELSKIEKDLAALNEKHPLLLTVVSESDRMLARCFPNPTFPVEFVPWTLDGCAEAIRNSDVVVIPNSDNDFARHKSANRAILALSNGKPVVASKVQSLEPFSDCILFDDFENAIARYFEDPALVERHVKRGVQVIDDEFSPKKIASLWGGLIEELQGKPVREKRLENDFAFT